MRNDLTDHLSQLSIHKSVGPDRMHQGILIVTDELMPF